MTLMAASRPFAMWRSREKKLIRRILKKANANVKQQADDYKCVLKQTLDMYESLSFKDMFDPRFEESRKNSLP